MEKNDPGLDFWTKLGISIVLIGLLGLGSMAFFSQEKVDENLSFIKRPVIQPVEPVEIEHDFIALKAGRSLHPKISRENLKYIVSYVDRVKGLDR